MPTQLNALGMSYSQEKRESRMVQNYFWNAQRRFRSFRLEERADKKRSKQKLYLCQHDGSFPQRKAASVSRGISDDELWNESGVSTWQSPPYKCLGAPAAFSYLVFTILYIHCYEVRFWQYSEVPAIHCVFFLSKLQLKDMGASFSVSEASWG